MDALAVAEQLYDSGVKNVRAILPDGKRTNLRLARATGGSLCYMRNRSRRYGFPLYNLHPIEIHPIVSRKPEQKKWEDGWNKVRAKLIESGLWSDIVKEIDIALKLGYDKMNQAYKEYWETPNDKQVALFFDKYPELTDKNDSGCYYIRTSIVWQYAKMPIVKKMRFNKYNNEQELQAIQKAMDEKRDYSAYGRTSYDVSFEYKAEKQKAFYSEEFKGCGNGHYWLAISATHCLWYEND